MFLSDSNYDDDIDNCGDGYIDDDDDDSDDDDSDDDDNDDDDDDNDYLR